MTLITFQTRFQELNHMLLSFAFKLTRNTEDAKDLLQETSFKALKYREKFQTGSNFKAWLFTIMKNTFINNYRRQKKSNIVNDSSENGFLIDSGNQITYNTGQNNLRLQEIHERINALNFGLRKPFMMHFEGYKYQEIADELALPLGTVKSRIFFARKVLKSQLSEIID